MEYVIIGVLISALTFFLAKESNRSSDLKDDQGTVLRPSKIFKYIGLFFIVAGILMVTLVWIRLNNPYSLNEALVMSVVAIFVCGLTALYMMRFAKNHYAKFNEEKIVVSDWRGRVREIYWKDVVKIKNRPFASTLSIYDARKRLSIHHYVVGLKDLVKMIEQKTDYTARDLRIPVK